MSYVIEENVPLPAARQRGNSVGPQTEWTRLVNSLLPGQSVLTPLHNEFKAAEQLIMRNRPRKYAIRKIAGEGWRVWRIE